jgi:hypothetical protein
MAHYSVIDVLALNIYALTDNFMILPFYLAYKNIFQNKILTKPLKKRVKTRG